MFTDCNSNKFLLLFSVSVIVTGTGIEIGEETEVVAGSITVMIVEEGEVVAVVEFRKGGNLVAVLENHTGI